MKKIIIVPSKPVPKGRPRFVYNQYTHKPAVYTPKKTLDYEKFVAQCARDIENNEPIDGYFKMSIVIYFKIPKSWSKKKREEAKEGKLKPVVGDIDNYVKSICDGLNGVAYKDDKYMYELNASKKYGEKDLAIIVLEYDEDND